MGGRADPPSVTYRGERDGMDLLNRGQEHRDRIIDIQEAVEHRLQKAGGAAALAAAHVHHRPRGSDTYVDHTLSRLHDVAARYQLPDMRTAHLLSHHHRRTVLPHERDRRFAG